MGEALDGQQHHFNPVEISAPHIIYVAVGLFIVVFSMFSMFIKERLYLGEAPIALVFGIIVGPVAAKIVEPSSWGGNPQSPTGSEVIKEVTLEVMRVCIALSVFSVGVELPKKYVWRHWRSIGMLLGPVMLWGWLISAMLIWALIPGLDFLNSLVIASCVSPTDPILAQAVVGGPWAERHVPTHIRHLLQCESGCNDGAAFPFLYLAYYLTVNRGQIAFPVGKWFYLTWAWEICLGTTIGAMIGFVTRKMIKYSERKKLVDRESFVVQYLCLALASMGVNTLIGSDDLLAAFACGTAFAWDGWFQQQTADSNFSNIVDLVFNIAVFIYIGTQMPWHSFNDQTINLSVWRLIVLSILVLLLKRIPIVIALWKFIPDIKTFHEALFSGYFGPMGVGAIFMCTLGRLLLPEQVSIPPQSTNDVLTLTIEPIVYFFVLSSVIVHGFTVPFFAFGRRAHVNLARTFTTQSSFVTPGDEPAWMSGVRRLQGGTEDGAQRPATSVVQAMMKGAGGDDHEKELSNDDSESGKGHAHEEEQRTHEDELPSPGSDRADSARPMMTSDQPYGQPDDEESVYSWNSDWGGEDTKEARQHRARQSRNRAGGHVEEKDIGDHPLRSESPEHGDFSAHAAPDLEAGRHAHDDDQSEKASVREQEQKEEKYPHVYQWSEGHNIVIEYQASPGADVDTLVFPVSEKDHHELAGKEHPFEWWLSRHSESLERALGSEHHKQIFEPNMEELWVSGALHKLAKRMKEMNRGGDTSGRPAPQADETDESEDTDSAETPDPANIVPIYDANRQNTV
ncbi:hypothetical protein MSPP1_001950 [Malassezia sp. CBS 17886]|nr:hypothetical protein MSPP1_001950 [Malassezia sp. CBS 17886]